VVVVNIGVVGDPKHPGDERTVFGPVSVSVFDDLEKNGLDQVLAGLGVQGDLEKEAE